MRKLIFILFLGLIALICGPPSIFASETNPEDATTVAKKNFLKYYNESESAGAITSITNQNQDLSWTKTVAADQQPSLPEYKGNTNYNIDLPPTTLARLPGTKIFEIYTKFLKNTPIPGLGRRLHQEA